MGNVKPSYIKNLAAKLLETYPAEFSRDLAVNKSQVTQRTNIRSKNIRNRVAGYISNLKRIEVERKEREARAPPQGEEPAPAGGEE